MTTDPIWIEQDRQWAKCMKTSGYQVEGTSFDFIRGVQQSLDEIPPGGEERAKALEGALTTEITTATADDRCRKSTLDTVEPKLILKIRQKIIQISPELVLEAQRVLQKN